MPAVSVLRSRTGLRGVTNMEVFFDLVYAFAVTQLSHYLLENATPEGVLRTALLFGFVYIVWASTAYLLNWLDPNNGAVRLMLIAIMIGSLVMSAGLPEAFDRTGLLVGASYAAMQIGRYVFALFALRGEPLERNFVRLLIWSSLSGALAVAGGFEQGQMRELLWALAIGIDLFDSGIGFYVPGLGRSRTRDWVLDGGHVAERNHAFVMIALGESIVIIGASLAVLGSLTAGELIAFVLAFGTTAGLWWVYFDRAAPYAARAIASAPDPGRLARSAYYWIHPVMIGGIITVAAGERLVLMHPESPANLPTVLIVLGGAALFLVGHALFKVAVWHGVPWSRLAGATALLLLIPISLGFAWPALAIGALPVVVVSSVVARDRSHRLPDDLALASGEGLSR